MLWSPADDILFVVESSYPPQDDTKVCYLIDVEAEEVITSFELVSIHDAAWSRNGEFVVFYYLGEQPDDPAARRPTLLRTLSVTGDIIDRPAKRLPDFQVSDLWAIEPHLFSTDWLLFYTPDEISLIAENLVTGESIEFRAEAGASLVQWNTAGDACLLWNERTGDLWLLSIPERRIVLIAENASFGISTYMRPRMQVWSPARNQAVFAVDGALYLFDPDEQRVEPLSGIDTKVTLWTWSSDGESLIIGTETEGPGNRLSYYDIEQAQQTPLAEEAWDAVPSPDMRYVALLGRVPPTIIDLEQHTTYQWMPHSGSTMSYVDNYRWDVSSKWIITAEDMTFAGGGGGPTANGVAKADGTLHRELNRTSFTITGISWLPDRVIPFLAPGQPESVLQQPVMSLEHDGEVLGVAWSPDGRRIASYNRIRPGPDPGMMNIWDITRDSFHLVNQYTFPFCGDRPLPCMLSWSPDSRLLAANRIPTAEIWDPATGTQLAQLPEVDIRWTDDGYEGLPFLSAYSPDGGLLAQLTDERDVIEIRDTGTGERMLSIPAGRVFRFEWSPTGQQLAVLDAEEQQAQLRLWNVPSGDYVDLAFTKPYNTWDFAFNPDGMLLVWGSYYDQIRIFDTSTGNQLQQLNWSAKALDFSPDGTRLAAAGTWAVTIWDILKINAR
jgi:WD40 repeat protein